MAAEEESGRQAAEHPRKPSRKGRPSEEKVQRMIFEEELRQSCLGRSIDLAEQRAWMAFRKKLPISQWVNRSESRQFDSSQKKRILLELKEYLRTFTLEAAHRSLKLDMGENYYEKAVELLGNSLQGETPGPQDQETLTDLMILVDCKDSTLGIQIVQSIL